jgi:hypothetical protein
MEGNKMSNAQQVIVTVMAEVNSVAKKDKNQSQGFNFRGIDAVMNAVGPALRKAGGFIVPEVLGVENTAVPSASGKSLNVVRVSVKYSVFGTEGEPIVGIIAAEAFDSGDKATAKAMSVAYRTFLLQLLCLPTDEPDPDHDSYEIGKIAVDLGGLVDWAEVIKSATTQAELKNAWTEIANAGLAEVPFKGTTLKKLIFERKAQVK